MNKKGLSCITYLSLTLDSWVTFETWNSVFFHLSGIFEMFFFKNALLLQELRMENLTKDNGKCYFICCQGRLPVAEIWKVVWNFSFTCKVFFNVLTPTRKFMHICSINRLYWLLHKELAILEFKYEFLDAIFHSQSM